MKKLIILLSFLVFSNIYAGDTLSFEASLNAGVSSGSGPGIALNIVDRVRIKLDGTYLHNGDSLYLFVGGSLAYYFSDIDNKSSNFYFSIGYMNLLKEYKFKIRFLTIAGGWKKFITENLFYELELGIGAFQDSDTLFFSVMPGVALGYRF